MLSQERADPAEVTCRCSRGCACNLLSQAEGPDPASMCNAGQQITTAGLLAPSDMESSQSFHVCFVGWVESSWIIS